MGDREGEAFQVATAGACLAAIGQIELAVESYQRALAYAREAGDRRFEARQMGNLGVAHGCLGDSDRAVDRLEQAKRLASELGDRLVEAGALVNLGDVLTDQHDWATAMSSFEAGIRIADEIQDPDLRARGRWGMALAALCTGDLARSQVLAEQAREFLVPLVAHEIVLLGLILVRASQPRKAETSFRAALRHADDLLAREARLFAVLDAKGLALSGLALVTGEQDHAASAAAAYSAARSITRARGVVGRAALLFDQLAAADHANALSRVGPAVRGEEPS